MKEYDIKYMAVSLRMTDETSISDTRFFKKLTSETSYQDWNS